MDSMPRLSETYLSYSAVLYPDLSTVMYSRLSNAFIIGMILGMLGFGYI
jgi:hypothetical protein